MIEVRLSEKQREIVETSDGAVLVLAGAGSGKTRVLTERVRYLISRRPGKFKVLALTFTNKAAEEMQNRLKGLPEAESRAFIGTIHKFCLDLIRSQGNTIGISEMPHLFERDDDRLEVLIEVFNNNPILKEYIQQIDDDSKRKSYLINILNHISQKKKNLGNINPQYGYETEELSLIFEEYNSILSSQNAIDFDDVICLAYKIFAERPKVAELYRKMYKYVCIDEAQDLNFSQYELIKILCGDENKNVLMVGDANQAIYGFNGSDKTYMTERFISDFSARQIVLLENYRSSIQVLNAANKLIPRSSDNSLAVIEGEFAVKGFNDEKEEAFWVVDKIKGFLEKKTHPDIEGEITPEKIAILGRNRYVFQQVEQRLRKEDIGYFIRKANDSSNYESDLIKAFDLGTRILVNHADKLHLQQLAGLLQISNTQLTPESGIDKLKDLKLRITDSEMKGDMNILVSAWELVNLNVNSFLKALALIEDYINKDFFYTNNPNKKSLVIQDIGLLKEQWKKYSIDSSSESKSLSGFRNQVALGIPTSSNNASEVTIGTVHSVKGLEFDIVFLIGMNEGTFPDYRSLKNTLSLNEERNNAFVAITRSRRLLYMTYPKQKFMPWDKNMPVAQKPSRYLLAMQ